MAAKRWRSATVALVVLALIGSLLALAVPPPSVAGAEPGPEATKFTSFPTDCYGVSTLNAGAEEVNAIDIDVTAPTVVRQGDEFTVRVAPAPTSLPSGKNSVLDVVPVLALTSVDMMFDLPAGTTFVSAGIVPDTGFGTRGQPSVSLDTSYTPARVVLNVPKVPGNPQGLLGYTPFQLPAFDVVVGATGAPGTSAEARFSGTGRDNSGYDFVAHSSVQAAVSCWPRGHIVAPALSATAIVAPGVTATSTSLVASPGAIPDGNEATLRATVSTPAGPARPQGSVEFFDGGSSLGEAEVDLATGVATLEAPLSGVGVHLLRATYQGTDGFFSASSSAQVPVSVTDPAGRDATLVSMAATPDDVEAASTGAVVINGTVASLGEDTSPRTGAVKLYDNGVFLESADLVDSHVTFQRFTKVREGHVYTAEYVGDPNFEGSSGTTSVVSHLSPDTFVLPVTGQVNLNASATADVPAGSTYRGTFNTLEGGEVDLGGVFSAMPLTLVAGDRTLVGSLHQAGPADGQVEADGDANLETAFVLQVDRLQDGAETFHLASGCVVGPFEVELSGSRSGGGVVTVSTEDFTVPNVADGTCVSTEGDSAASAVNAVVAGSTAELSLSFSPPAVAAATTVTLSVTTPSPTAYGQPITLSAVVNSGQTAGVGPNTIVYYDGDEPIAMAQVGTAVSLPPNALGNLGTADSRTYSAPLEPGEHQFSARFVPVRSAPANLSPVVGRRESPPSNVVNHTVGAPVAPTATSLSLSVSPSGSSAVGTPVTVTANLTPAPIVAGSTPPLTGVVYFYDGDTNLLGSNLFVPNGNAVNVAASNNGTISQTFTDLEARSYDFRAVFVPSNPAAWAFTGSQTATVTHTVTGTPTPTEVLELRFRQGTSANSPGLIGDQVYFPPDLGLIARVAPGIAGTVQWYLNGVPLGAVANVTTSTGLSAVRGFNPSNLGLPGSYEITAEFVPTSSAFGRSTASRPLEVIEPFQVPTVTTVTVNPVGPVDAGMGVTLTATVAATSGIPLYANAGSVEFYDGDTLIQTVPYVGPQASSPSAQVPNLSAGVHDLRAVFVTAPPNGPAGIRSGAFLSSEGAVQVTAVTPGSPLPTTVNLAMTTASSPVVLDGPTVVGANLVLQASGFTPGVTGTIQFYADEVPLGPPAVVGLTTTALTQAVTPSPAVGSYDYRVEFTPDSANFLPSEDELTHQVVATGPVPSVTLLSLLSPAEVASGGTVNFGGNVGPRPPASAGILGTAEVLVDGAPIAATVNVSAIGLISTSSSFNSSLMSVGEHMISLAFTPADGRYNPSVSNELPIKVIAAPVPTTTVLSVDPADGGFAGQPVSLTATVNPAVAGTVSFFDGGNFLADVPVVGGEAVLTSSTFSLGLHDFRATFAPQVPNTYPGSESNVIEDYSITAETSTSLSVSPAGSSWWGSAVTLDANITPSNAPGVVSFFDGDVEVGSGPVTAGHVQAVLDDLAPGAHGLRAEFTASDGLFSDSASPTVDHFVMLVGSEVTLETSPAGEAELGEPVTLTATVDPDALDGFTTGQVTFFDGETPLGSAEVVDDTAVLETDDLTVGPHSLTAGFAGTAPFGDSVSEVVPLLVGIHTEIDLSVEPSEPTPQNDPFTLTATLDPEEAQGTVTFFDGATSLGSSAVEDGEAVLVVTQALSVGTHSLTASFVGTTPYLDSVSDAVSHEVLEPVEPVQTETSLAVQPAEVSLVGTDVTLIATVGPSDAPGTVTFFDGDTEVGSDGVEDGIATLVLADLALGDHVFSAHFASGDELYLPSESAPVDHEVVEAADTTTTLAVEPVGSSIVGADVTLTATVEPTEVPGSVAFLDGDDPLGTVEVIDGQASLVLEDLPTGTYELSAVFSSNDPFFNGSESDVVEHQVLAPGETTTALVATPAGSSTVGQDVTLTATVNPAGVEGTVTFFDGGGDNPIGSGPVNPAGVASIVTDELSLGAHGLYAQFVPALPGHLGSMSNIVIHIVAPPAATTTALAVTPEDTSTVGQAVTLSATVSPSGAAGSVTFFDGEDPLGTVEVIAGQAPLVLDELAVGDYLFSATFTPSLIGYLGSTSNPVAHEVIDAVGPPSPPLNPTATAQALQATVSWDAPLSDGGAPIGSYVVRNAENQVVATTSAAVTSVAVIGLTEGSIQAFTITAINEHGESDASVATAPVTIGGPDQTFPDVPPGAPFYDEINWAITEGITNGFEDGTFKGTQSVSRQATAAFLYRLAGEPAFVPPTTPSFNDVATNSPFYTEIEWLVSIGVTNGFADGGFHPTAGTPRQAMAAFLYRFAGEPAFTPPSTPTFPDVPTTNAFYTEIEWLATTGITTGFEDGGFHPVQEVTRQAMVAFLYRFSSDFVPPTVG